MLINLSSMVVVQGQIIDRIDQNIDQQFKHVEYGN